MESPTGQWTLFFQRCRQKRLRGEQFDKLASKLHERDPLPGPSLAECFLSPEPSQKSIVDPLVPVYIERLLALDKIDVSDVLHALFKHSRDCPRKSSFVNQVDDGDHQSHNPSELEEILLNRLARAFASGEIPKKPIEVQKALRVLSQWMSAMVAASTSESMMQAMTGNVQQVQHQAMMVREALGILVVSMVENAKVVGVIDTAMPKVDRRSLGQSLSLFIPFLSQTHMQLANRIEIFQKEHKLIGDPLPGASQENDLDVAAIQLEAVVDLPVNHTRAGLYIFINALLVARPLTDDNMILNYINMRYKGDIRAMATDLIVASFDVLANAMYRSEPVDAISSLKSFLINKVPTLLTILSPSMYPPFPPEFCITQAWNSIDPNAFPSFSQSFGLIGGNTSLSDVRQDFLFACTSHGLLPAEAIPRLLGEQPMSTIPRTGSRYLKETLVSQCSNNPGRVEQLLDELEKFDGNAGAIVAAVSEIIRDLCATKETRSLKTICNVLSRKSQSLDVILQFASPTTFLQPLCQLLDAWRYEDDQGDLEYQPVYDEFAAILLLVLAFVYRYNLKHRDLGVSHSSFIGQLLDQGHVSQAPDELSEDQSRHLTAWLRALLDSEGMSDETMRSCRPQEFYLLVPTLFSQTVFACSSEVLSIDTIKNGLEYLLETFLLPSLVGAFIWISYHLWEQTHEDIDIVLQILHKLMRPTSTSADAQAMHGTIMSIVSKRLDRSLRAVKQRHPSRQDIDPLLEALKPHMHYERTAYSSLTELESWTAAPNNMKQSIRSTVQSLVLWSSTADLNMTPPSYTHRELHVLTALFGAKKVLRAIIEEVASQTEHGSLDLALDVATSLICAPSADNSPIAIDWGSPTPGLPTSSQASLNLRDMLRQEFAQAAELVSTDMLTAETIVRLHRSVEAQLSSTSMTGLAGMTAPLADMGASMANMLPPLDITVTDAVAAATAPLDQALDPNGGVAGFDMGDASTTMDLAAGQDEIDAVLQSAAEDDVFAGLDTEMGDYDF